MNHYNQIPGILETGAELVSPHLRWLIKNTILEHCPSTAINMIAYNEDIPVNVFGFADGPTRSIAINLKYHFDAMRKVCEKQEQIYTSIKTLLLHEILDTVIHEAHHLKVCEEKKSFKTADLDEEGAIAAASEKSWKVAKFWDCNLTTFGTFFDEKINDFIEAIEFDTKEKPQMWQDLQVYMHKNNLGYFNADKGTELSIAQAFEASAKDPLVWTRDAVKFLDTIIQTVEETQPQIDVNVEVPKDGYDAQMPINQSALDAARALLQQSLVNTQVDTPYQEDEVPYEHDEADGHPWLDTQAHTPTPMTPTTVPMQAHTLEKTIETVLRTLFWHVTSKCEFTTEGGYNNPYAVIEPVSIAHIPGASQLFTHMDCYDEKGKYIYNIPTTEGIRGIVTKANMPRYELYMYLNGVHHKRTFMAYDNNAVDSRTNDYKPWAKVVRGGTKLMYVLHNTEDATGAKITKTTAKITLERGLPLGQEKFEFLKWKQKQA